jgi:methionyl-tRNA formyltransferase
MRIVFFGAGEFGVPTLRALSERHAVVACVSQPDRPAGRGGKMTPTPISQWVMENLSGGPGVPGVAAENLIRTPDVNEPATRERVRGFTADAWVVIAFGQKLSPELLAGKFAVNLHGSRLPRWRGAAPVNWAILAGDEVSGNSVITLAERMDAGLILTQTTRAITPEMTAGELHDALSADGPEAVLKVLAEHEAGTLRGQTQDPTLVTKARKLSREDGVVDFAKSAEECRRWINGLSPWPGVTANFRGEAVKLVRAGRDLDATGTRDTRSTATPTSAPPRSPAPLSTPAPGTILNATAGTIAAGNGTTLRLVEVQPAGKRAMSWQEFARGRAVKDGERIE